MSDERHKGFQNDPALEQIERAILDADTAEIEELMRALGSEDDIRAEAERLRRGVAGITSSFASRVKGDFVEAALVGAKNPIAARARLRIAFAISAEPKLGEELKLKLESIKTLPDDVAIAMYDRLWREGKLT